MRFLKAPLKASATNPRWVCYPLEINIFNIGANCFHYIASLYEIYLGVSSISEISTSEHLKTAKRPVQGLVQELHILWLDGNSNCAPPCSACLHAGPHPLANCTARPSLQVLEHIFVGCTELPRLLQVEPLCFQSRVCSTAKAQQCKGRTVCEINVCAAN